MPALWLLEMSDALLVGERRKWLSAEEAAETLGLLSKLPLDVDAHAEVPLAADLMPLARRQNLSAYDAAYLELARHRNLPLATLDRALREAAAMGGIPVA